METKIIKWEQYINHISPKDCWVLVNGSIYDVSDYLVQHPGGDDILLNGDDGSQKFNNVGHSQYAISLRDARYVGQIQKNPMPENYLDKLKQKKEIIEKKIKSGRKRKIFRENLTRQEVSLYKSQQNCWIIIDNKVYDCSQYLQQHPGGVGKIMQYAGKDATKGFSQAGHSLDAIKKRQQLLIGNVKSEYNFVFILIFVLIFAAGLYFWNSLK